jgi:hypothetical protein
MIIDNKIIIQTITYYLADQFFFRVFDIKTMGFGSSMRITKKSLF